MGVSWADNCQNLMNDETIIPCNCCVAGCKKVQIKAGREKRIEGKIEDRFYFNSLKNIDPGQYFFNLFPSADGIFQIKLRSYHNYSLENKKIKILRVH